MSKLAIILGSDGVVSSTTGTDLIREISDSEGWILRATRSLEFFAVDDVKISINGRTAFTLKAGDELEEKVDFIKSLIIMTDGARYRYYAKF